MFEAAELGRTIPKEEYKARVPILRSELLDVQQELIRARFPVIIVFAGVDGAGQGRDRQPAERLDGPALDRDARLRGAVRRGERTAGVLALLARPAADTAASPCS